jgi:hypothetical protein
MKRINMTDLIIAPKLKSMNLSNNPLRNLFSTEHSHALSLQVLELSHTHLQTFDGASFPFLQHLQKLDLSSSLMTLIGNGGFRSFKHLKTLDISDTSFREARFPRDLFLGLNELSAIFTPNYRLCCDDILPTRNKPLCFSHERTLSSCENLLLSSAHQITMAALSLAAVAGNAACLLLRHTWYVEHAAVFPLSWLLTHLNVANLLTGVYCAMVAVADYTFRMTYASQEVA